MASQLHDVVNHDNGRTGAMDFELIYTQGMALFAGDGLLTVF